jgi:type VI secretion system protein ImpL
VPILRGFYFTSGTQEGTPLERVVGAMGRAFGLKAMYQGDKLFEPALKQYISSLRTGFLLPVKDKLEERLKKARGGETYAQDYYALKAYLLLNDKDHLQDDYEWQVQELDKYWVEALRGSSGGVSEEELRAKVDPHVRTYLTLLKSGTITGEQLDMPRIEAVRGMLSRVKGADQYYQRFVVALKDELDDRGQKKYPPVTLGTMFADRQEVFTYVQSRRKNLESKYQEVEGPFTFEGYQTVMASLKDGFKALEREEWVVPLSVEEKRKNAEIQKELDRVKEIYQKEYIRQWEDFFRDLEVKSPKTNKEAISEYRVLSTPDWPYLRLLRALSDATSFKKAENEMVKAANVDGGVVDQIRTRVVQKVESKTRTRVADLVGDRKGEPPNPITEKFKSMVEFGVPPAPVKKASNPDADEAPPPPPVETSLSKYIKLLEQLSGEMAQIEESPFATDTKKATELFENAVKEREGCSSSSTSPGRS